MRNLSCDHVWELDARRFRCTKCRRPLNPWWVYWWERAKIRWWIWRGRVERMRGR